MRKDVVGYDASRFHRMYARLDRQAGEYGKHFRNRVPAHKSPVLPPADTQQRRPGLSVLRMALLGGGNQDCRIKENVHPWLRFQNGRNPFLAHFFKDALPVCPRFWAALMDPQTIDLDHGRPLFDPLEKHALRSLNSLKPRVRLEAQPLAERFRDYNSPRFINPEFHTIDSTIYHSKWHKHVMRAWFRRCGFADARSVRTCRLCQDQQRFHATEEKGGPKKAFELTWFPALAIQVRRPSSEEQPERGRIEKV